MMHVPVIHTVCPNCKRPVEVLSSQKTARCAEHGMVVPMRSAIANPPLRQTPNTREM